MLVVSRKESEVVFLDIPPSTEHQRIGVCVADLNFARVKLGFTAPKEVKILRSELDPAPNSAV